MKFEKLKNIIAIAKGKKHTFSDVRTSTSIRFIQIDDLRNDDNLKYTNDAKGVLVNEEDLLIAWDGANAGTIGYGKEGFIGSTIAALKKFDSVSYNTEFLGKFLQSKFRYLRSRATGATIPHINRKILETLKIPIFEISDQIRIATLLSHVEALIAKRKESIRLLDEMLKSTFWEMFGDPVRNEKKWNKKSLGEILRVKHGYAFKSDFFKKSGEYVLLTPGNFYEKSGYRDRGEKQKYYAGEIPEEYLLKKGNMLVAMTEQAPGLLGSPIIVPESNKFLHNQRLGLIVPRKENIQTLFLFHLFNTVTIRRKIHSKATGTKVRHTSPTKIEEITVGCPPLNLQNQFAPIVQKTEALKSKYQSSLQEFENLYSSLTQRAFSGKLDLSGIPVELSGKAEIATKQESIQAELEIKPKAKKKPKKILNQNGYTK